MLQCVFVTTAHIVITPVQPLSSRPIFNLIPNTGSARNVVSVCVTAYVDLLLAQMVVDVTAGLNFIQVRHFLHQSCSFRGLSHFT